MRCRRCTITAHEFSVQRNRERPACDHTITRFDSSVIEVGKGNLQVQHVAKMSWTSPIIRIRTLPNYWVVWNEVNGATVILRVSKFRCLYGRCSHLRVRKPTEGFVERLTRVSERRQHGRQRTRRRANFGDRTKSCGTPGTLCKTRGSVQHCGLGRAN